jgi:sporulation protein YlmC with PRC-barrel domain
MQTKKIALVSTILIGLGGAAALAQQTGAESQDPILDQDRTETLQQTQDAPPEVMEDGVALTPEQGVAGEGTYHEPPAQDTAGDMRGERWPSVASAPEPYTETVLGGMTVEELIGMDVVDDRGESVGSVSDLLLTADNAIDRAIIDVGGFLGLGAKPVAIELDRLTIAEGDGEVMVDVTREELEAMSEWQQDEDGWFSG